MRTITNTNSIQSSRDIRLNLHWFGPFYTHWLDSCPSIYQVSDWIELICFQYYDYYIVNAILSPIIFVNRNDENTHQNKNQMYVNTRIIHSTR